MSTDLVVRGIREGKVPAAAYVAVPVGEGIRAWKPLAEVPAFGAALNEVLAKASAPQQSRPVALPPARPPPARTSQPSWSGLAPPQRQPAKEPTGQQPGRDVAAADFDDDAEATIARSAAADHHLALAEAKPRRPSIAARLLGFLVFAVATYILIYVLWLDEVDRIGHRRSRAVYSRRSAVGSGRGGPSFPNCASERALSVSLC